MQDSAEGKTCQKDYRENGDIKRHVSNQNSEYSSAVALSAVGA